MTDLIPSFDQIMNLDEAFSPSIQGRFELDTAKMIGVLPDDISEYAEKDHFPIPGVRIREGYGGESDSIYWASGYRDYHRLRKKLPIDGNLLDFGCATGRVLRHFALSRRPIYGADLNINNVRWCLRGFPKIEVINNSVLPHLPYEDNFFKSIYAFSVFTHIDRDELPWLAELRRILAPGGKLYITVHGDRAWRERTENGLESSVLTASTTYELYSDHPRIPDGRCAFSHQAKIEAFANVFHSHDYIKDIWGRGFDIESIETYDHFYQDGVMLVKKSE